MAHGKRVLFCDAYNSDAASLKFGAAGSTDDDFGIDNTFRVDIFFL